MSEGTARSKKDELAAYNEVIKDHLMPYRVLDELIKYIIENTEFYGESSPDERYKKAVKALWGDREKVFARRGGQKKRYDKYALGVMYDLLRSGDAKDISDAAWQAAEKVLGKDAPGEEIEQFKYVIAREFPKSKEAHIANGYKSPDDMYDLLQYRLYHRHIRDIKLVMSWLDQYEDDTSEAQ